MSTRPAGGSSNLSLPGGDMDSAKRVLSWAVSFEKLLEDPCGVHHFTVSNMFHLGVVFYFRGCVCSHRLFPCRPSWSLRWAQRTFYSGRLVRSSRRSLQPLWMRWGGPSLHVCRWSWNFFFQFKCIKIHYKRKHAKSGDKQVPNDCKVATERVLIFSWKKKLAPSTMFTCLRMPPTLSTLMTQPRQRRQTCRRPPLTCLTKLKRRCVCPIMHWCMLTSKLEVCHCPLLHVRYLNWWRWTATGDLCALLSTRAAPWHV